MVDYLPGTGQKIAFNQHENDKIALVYRLLKDKGYEYRMRVYNFDQLDCDGLSFNKTE